MSSHYNAIFERVDQWLERDSFPTSEYRKLATLHKQLFNVKSFLVDDEVPNMPEVMASRDPYRVPMEVRERFEKYLRMAKIRMWELAFGYYFGAFTEKAEVRRRSDEIYEVVHYVDMLRRWVHSIDKRELGKDGGYYSKRESKRYTRQLRKAFDKEQKEGGERWDFAEEYNNFVNKWRNGEVTDNLDDAYLRELGGAIYHAHLLYFVDGHLEDNSFYVHQMNEVSKFCQAPTEDIDYTLGALHNLPYFVCKLAAASKIETESDEWNVQCEGFQTEFALPVAPPPESIEDRLKSLRSRMNKGRVIREEDTITTTSRGFEITPEHFLLSVLFVVFVVCLKMVLGMVIARK